MNRKLLILVVGFLYFSCSSPYFKAIEGEGNCPLMLEARTQAGFELRFTNSGKSNLVSPVIEFDQKYKHSLSGLYSVEHGLIKDSLFRAGDTLTFLFDEDISNKMYFKFDEKDYVPKEITLSCTNCSTKWILK